MEKEKAGAREMRFVKRLKRAWGAPKRELAKAKGAAFATGWDVVRRQYAGMMADAEALADGIEAGAVSDKSKRFLGRRAFNFFPGRVTRHLYSDEELAELERNKERLLEVKAHAEGGVFSAADAHWLRCNFVAFLERCRDGDVQRLFAGLKPGKSAGDLFGEEVQDNDCEKG